MKTRSSKIKYCIVRYIIYIFLFSVLFNFDTVYAEITTIVSTREAEETTKPWGVKIEDAQYYDYVEYDDQGRLVDKNHIIIAKGEGGSGEGGGYSGGGYNSVDSSGRGSSGTSGGGGAQAGQGGSSGSGGGGTGSGNGVNTMGGSSNGISYQGPSGSGYSSSGSSKGGYNNAGQSGNNQQKLQEAAAQAALQQSVEAELATAGARKNAIMESLRNKQYQESLERESMRQESRRQEAIRRETYKNGQQRNIANNKAVVVSPDIKATETTSYEFRLDKETVSPKSHVVEQETVKSTTQPKVTEKNSVTPDQFIEKETKQTTVYYEETTFSPEKTVTNEGRVEQPKANIKPSLSPDQFIENVYDKVIEQNINSVGPTVEETTIVEREVVSIEETYDRNDIANKSKKEEVEEIEEVTVAVDEKDDEGNNNEDLKKGDKGEEDHDDEDAAFKEEGGENQKDGKGNAIGGNNRGVKILELKTKGNIGLKAKPGINNIQGLIYAIVFATLLSIGILYYYLSYMYDEKINRKSNYIM